MISAKLLIALLLEATIDDNDSSTNNITLETPSVVNGVGEYMVVSPSSLDAMVMERMPERREKREESNGSNGSTRRERRFGEAR